MSQWLYEEMLSTPDPHYPFLGPQRSVIVGTIKKVCVCVCVEHNTVFMVLFIVQCNFSTPREWSLQ